MVSRWEGSPVGPQFLSFPPASVRACTCRRVCDA